MPNLEEPLSPTIWPLHPQPRPFEPLSLWLERVAREYGVRFRTFCRYGLGMNHEEISIMCRHPSDTILATISTGTGVSMARLREMTIGSLISQMQAELDVAIGEHEAIVTEWLNDRVLISDRSDRKYWETIEFWRQNKDREPGDNTGPNGLPSPPSQIGSPAAF